MKESSVSLLLVLLTAISMQVAPAHAATGPSSPDDQQLALVAMAFANDIVDPSADGVKPYANSHTRSLNVQIFKDLLSAYYFQMQELTLPSASPVRIVPYVLWASATQNLALVEVGSAANKAAGSNPTAKIERLRNNAMFLQGLVGIVARIERKADLSKYSKNHIRSLLLGVREVVKSILITDIDPMSGLQLKGAAEYLPTQRLYNVLLEEVGAKAFGGLAEIMPGKLSVRFLTALDSRIHKVSSRLMAVDCVSVIRR